MLVNVRAKAYGARGATVVVVPQRYLHYDYNSSVTLSLFVLVCRQRAARASSFNILQKLEPRADADVKVGCAARRVGSQLRRRERARAYGRPLAK